MLTNAGTADASRSQVTEGPARVQSEKGGGDGPMEDMLARLDTLGQSLCRTRKLAIEGRFNSGIEQEWQDVEDSYEGIDEANRNSEHRTGQRRWRKPSDSNGVLTDSRMYSGSNRSSVFMNITSKYVDSAAARIGDMLLPSDDRPWALKPTPVPELTIEVQQAIATMAGGNPNDLVALQAQRDQQMEIAKQRAVLAQDAIDDWLTECQWHSHVRRCLDDSAKYGTGVMKGPYPMRKKLCLYTQQGIKIKEEVKPVSKRIDVWNLYPDPLCGDSVQNGEYVWERDEITAKTLRKLRGTPNYIDEQIDRCLKEGPQRPVFEGKGQRSSTGANMSPETAFEIWYHHGVVKREDLMAAGCDCSGDDTVAIPAVITMVNDHVIKAALNPLDKGDFPYDLMVWQERANMPWGIGIAKQVETAQRVLNAAERNMMDNAGLSAGPQIIMFENVIRPADGKYELVPRKFWIADPNADIRQVEHAFVSIQIESRQQDLMAIIEHALRMAEDVTGLPMLMQGQQGQASDTYGGMSLLNNNANSVMRRIARFFDYRITEPHIQRYHDWLMEYGEDDAAKGLFVIDARGSSALVERDQQTQSLMQMAQMALQPTFGIDPRKFATEFSKAHRLDPKKLMYDEEQWKQIQQAQAQQPQDPALQIAQMKIEADQQKMDFDGKLEQLQMNHEKQMQHAESNTQKFIEQMKREIAVLGVVGKKEQTESQIKADLAKTAVQERNKIAMKNTELQMQREQPAPPSE